MEAAPTPEDGAIKQRTLSSFKENDCGCLSTKENSNPYVQASEDNWLQLMLRHFNSSMG